MPVPLVLSMAKRRDPFDWLKPCWIRQWADRQRARNAFRNDSSKPRMTPEEARRDHRIMLRFLALNAAIGVLIGAAAGIALIALDIGGIGRLVSRASNPVLPMLLVIVPFASLFGATVTASAILTLPYDRKYREDDAPESED